MENIHHYNLHYVSAKRPATVTIYFCGFRWCLYKHTGILEY
jgi:hypothetical protein